MSIASSVGVAVACVLARPPFFLGGIVVAVVKAVAGEYYESINGLNVYYGLYYVGSKRRQLRRKPQEKRSCSNGSFRCKPELCF